MKHSPIFPTPCPKLGSTVTEVLAEFERLAREYIPKESVQGMNMGGGCYGWAGGGWAFVGPCHAPNRDITYDPLTPKEFEQFIEAIKYGEVQIERREHCSLLGCTIPGKCTVLHKADHEELPD